MWQQLQDIGGLIYMSKIKNAFEGKKAFLGFLTAGDPSLDKTAEFVLEMERAGATLIELGIPFTDPIADGPVIQAASYEAIQGGASQTVRSFRRQISVHWTQVVPPIKSLIW